MTLAWALTNIERGGWDRQITHYHQCYTLQLTFVVIPISTLYPNDVSEAATLPLSKRLFQCQTVAASPLHFSLRHYHEWVTLWERHTFKIIHMPASLYCIKFHHLYFNLSNLVISMVGWIHLPNSAKSHLQLASGWLCARSLMMVSVYIGATHLTSTITCTSFDVLNWPGRHLWRGRGCHSLSVEGVDWCRLTVLSNPESPNAVTMNIDGLPWPQNVLNTAKLS